MAAHAPLTEQASMVHGFKLSRFLGKYKGICDGARGSYRLESATDKRYSFGYNKESRMQLMREQQDTTANRWAGWHILTVAEAGFSMLDIYGGHQHGLDIEVIRQFADRVNERDEAGSLHPRAPISAVPRRFFREQENSRDPAVVNDLKRHIREFLIANQNTIHAQRILIDFHVSPAPVPSRYVEAAEEVVRLHGQDSIQEVVIFT